LRRQTQIFDIKSLPERAQDTCREHLDIIDALLAGDGDSASAAMARHIDGVRESIIARLTRR
jgi:DNA-binding GntR family transcriptional regulator